MEQAPHTLTQVLALLLCDFLGASLVHVQAAAQLASFMTMRWR